MESLELLDGVIDIYMPDFKTSSYLNAKEYLQAKDYPEVAEAAIREMHRQVGDLRMDEDGIALRGVLVRHLVMPGDAAKSRKVMEVLVDISRDMYLNIMGQYRPAGKVGRNRFVKINRPPTQEEFAEAYKTAQQAGLWRFDK